MIILGVNKYYQHDGGADRFFLDTERIVEESGHHFVPFCGRYSGNRSSTYERFFTSAESGSQIDRQSALRKAGYFVRGIYSLEARAKLRALLKEVRPDVAHVHNIYNTISPSVIDELNRSGVPTVYSMHDYNIFCSNGRLYRGDSICTDCAGGKHISGLLHGCYRGSRLASVMAASNRYLHDLLRTYQKVDVFSVPHNEMRKRVIALGAPGDRVKILRNPFEPNRFKPSFENDGYCVFLGRLIPAKGILTLLDAMEHVPPHVRLKILGTGPLEQTVAHRCGALGNVSLDTVSRWDSGAREIVQGARFVVVPSEWHSPLEYVLLESMAVGKPVVAANIGGAAAEVIAGRTGWLYEPGSQEALARTIRRAFDDPKACSEMGRNARAYVEQTYGASAFLSQVEELYNVAISNSRMQRR